MEDFVICPCPNNSKEFMGFINLKEKKILLVNYKVGSTTLGTSFNHKIGKKTGIVDESDRVFGDWNMVVSTKEMRLFTGSYDETEFSKMIVTRDPYTRNVSFFCKVFWDNELGIYIKWFRFVFGDETHQRLRALREQGEFVEAFNLFADSFWGKNLYLRSMGYEAGLTMHNRGDMHIMPQTRCFKGILSGVESVDLSNNMTERVQEFTGILEPDGWTRNRWSRSTACQLVKDSGGLEVVFPPSSVAQFNRFYYHDFVELEYEMMS